MRMPTQQLPRRLHETDSTWLERLIERSLQAQPPRPPSTPQQTPQQPTIEPKEDPKTLRDRQHHLTMRELRQQFLLGPFRPQQLSLLVTRGAQTPLLAGERHQVVVAALLAVHSGRALSEDPTVEVPMSSPLHAAAKPTVREGLR